MKNVLFDYRLTYRKFTKREKDVALQVMRGLPRKEIAGNLEFSLHTLDIHLQRIRKKLEVGTTAQAALKLSEFAR